MASRARRNHYISMTLAGLLTAVAFKFDESGIHWLWSDWPVVAAVWLLLGIVHGILWVREQKQLRQGQPRPGSGAV